MEGQVTLRISAEGLSEIEDVLNRESVQRRFPLLTSEHIATFLQGLRNMAHAIENVSALFKYARDPDDEHILNLACASQASFLVTWDKDILDLAKPDDPDGKMFRTLCPNTSIVTPVGFLSAILPESEPVSE